MLCLKLQNHLLTIFFRKITSQCLFNQPMFIQQANVIQPTNVIQPATHIEVEDTASSFDSTKAVGPNSIPVHLLKILGDYLSQPLAKIIH